MCIYTYRWVELPPLPTRPQDEPEYGAADIERVNKLFAALPETSRPDRWECAKVLQFWKSERPAMWQRLRRARIALKTAAVLLADRDAAIETGAIQGFTASEGISFFGHSEMLTTPEAWDYETELETWRDRVSIKGFDPDHALAFIYDGGPEWDESTDG